MNSKSANLPFELWPNHVIPLFDELSKCITQPQLNTVHRNGDKKGGLRSVGTLTKITVPAPEAANTPTARAAWYQRSRESKLGGGGIITTGAGAGEGCMACVCPCD